MNANQPSTEPERDWTAGVVAIIGRREESGLRGPVGAGFVVSDKGLLVTCAHVIDQTEWPYGQYDVPIQVRFNVSGRYADAYVQKGSVMPDIDLALLSLEDGLPDGVESLPMVASAGSEGHTTYMWGYPAGYKMGLRGEGRVLGEAGNKRLQLTSTQATHGYSGGPVWDDSWKRVIGMIVSGTNEDKAGRLQYENFAVPAEVLVDAYGDLLSLSPLDAAARLNMDNYNNRLLLRELKRALNMEDLGELSYNLSIELDDLPGTTRAAKARELILYCDRRQRVPELLRALMEVEDNTVDWYAVSGVEVL